MRKNQSREHRNQNNPHEYKAKNKHEHEKNRDNNLIEADEETWTPASVWVSLDGVSMKLWIEGRPVFAKAVYIGC